MGRLYTVPFASGTVTNAGGNADLWELTPADDKPIKLRGFILGQTSEVADAAEEAVNVSVIHLGATVTSGNGSSVTAVPLDPGISFPAAGFTAEINGATVATSSGTSTTVYEFCWNLRNSPCEIWFPDDRFCPVARQGAALVIRLNTTVADDITFAGTAIVEEE
jgi:hypothetical protein